MHRLTAPTNPNTAPTKTGEVQWPETHDENTGVQRRFQRTHAVLKLPDQVLLAAALVGLEHDFRSRALAVIGDVEKVAVIVEELLLSFYVDQVLAQHPERRLGAESEIESRWPPPG